MLNQGLINVKQNVVEILFENVEQNFLKKVSKDAKKWQKNYDDQIKASL
jgi:hypothetical protein